MNKQKIKLITLSTIFAAFTLIGCGKNLSFDEYMVEAKNHIEQGEVDAGIVFYKNAVRLQPKNADARFLLGGVYLSQGDYKNAKKELLRASELGTNFEMILPSLAEVHYKLNEFDSVYALVDSAVTLPDEKFVTILTYAGMAAIYEKQFENAQNYFDDALQVSSEFLYSKISKGYMARTQEEYSSAISSIGLLVKEHPDVVDLILLKGYLLQSNKQYQAAAESFIEYSKERPKEFSILFFIAQNYISANQPEHAEPIIDRILKIANNHPLANQLKAQILFDKKEFTLSKRYASNALQQNGSLVMSQIITGISAYYLKEYETAYQYLSKVSNKLSQNSLIRNIFAETQLILGYESEALASIQQLIDSNSTDSISLLTMSNELLNAGNDIAAKLLIDKASSLGEMNKEELERQGFLRLRLDDVEGGIAAFEESLKLDSNSAVAEEGLVIGYLRNKQYDLVMEIAKKWQKSSKKIASGLLLQATIEDGLQQYDQVKMSLTKLFKIAPNNIEGHFKMAIVNHKIKKYLAAFESYKQVLILSPTHDKAVLLVTRLAADSPSLLPEVKAFFQTLLLENNTPNIKLGLANLFRLENNLSEALKLYTELADKNSLDGVAVMVGDLYVLKNDLSKAISTYKNYYDKKKSSYIAGQRLIVAYEKNNQYDLAASLIKEMRSYHRNLKGLVLLNGYFQSLDKQTVSLADLNIIKESNELNKNWLANQMHGNIAYNEKRYEKAVDAYVLAYQKNPTQLTLMTLFKALISSGNNNKVIELSLNYLEQVEESDQVKMYLANAYLTTHQHEKALPVYRDLAGRVIDNPVLLNNLGYLELQEGNYSAAIKYAEQATLLLPSSIALLDTYAKALASNKQYIDSIKIYDKAIQLADYEQRDNIKIDKAELLIVMGSKKEAQDLLLEMKLTSSRKVQTKVEELSAKIK